MSLDERPGETFVFADMAPYDRYKMLCACVVPRPIAWVTTVDAHGTVNAAPFSFFNVFAEDPALVIIGIDRKKDGGVKDTIVNIEASNAFTVNLADMDSIDALVATAALFPPGKGEPDALRLTLEAGRTTHVPRLAEAPVSLECRLFELRTLSETRHLVLGEVTALVSRPGVYDPTTLRIDPDAYHPIARLHGAYYAGLGPAFERPVPDWMDAMDAASTGAYALDCQPLNDRSKESPT